MATPEELLKKLPPYKDEWVLINPRQSVHDIVLEVLEAHEEFSPYYDKIASSFNSTRTRDIAENIDKFLRRYIKYHEESENDQTTALPTGILTRKQGDCKHYSSFAGGILSALNRQGKNINWVYRFASYRLLENEPHHVFIAINPGKENEMWIDPTPGANKKSPIWILDKNINDMAIRRNIAGIDMVEEVEFIEIPVSNSFDAPALIAGPYWQLMPSFGAYGTGGKANPYFSDPFLRLQHYAEDNLSVTGTDWTKTADAVNGEISKGPMPGHAVNADFVKWVYENNLKGWNFYYPAGVQPGYVPNLPSYYPHLIMTGDNKLQLDRNQAIDDFQNNEIHALAAWGQDLINTYDSTPYPLTPQNLKIFSQGRSGDDLFREHRGKPLLKQIGEALGKVLKVVGKGVLKIVGAVPRNAFLGIVGLNLFNFAGNMWEKIQAGEWDQMAKKWKSLGGNPTRLRNTIEKGKSKKARYDEKEEVVLEDDAITGEPITAGAIIAAAAPIVAAMFAFIKNPKDQEKLRTVLGATKGALSQLMPDLDLSAFGFLDRTTGQELEFTIDPEDDESEFLGPGGTVTKREIEDLTGSGDILTTLKRNPLPVSLGAGLLTYMIVNKGGQKKNYIIPGIVAVAAYFFLKGSGGHQATDRRGELIAWANTAVSVNDRPAFLQVLNSMTVDEIANTHEFIFGYYTRGIKVPAGSELYNRIQAISTKYKIFT